MSHLPLDARAILEYLNELGYRNISAEQLKEFLKGMQPQSENSKSEQKAKNSNTNQQQQLPATTTTAAKESNTTTTTTANEQECQIRRNPIKVIKCKKPLCHFVFYLDICDHQITKKIESQINTLGGSLEFFLSPKVTHFVTDKTVLPSSVGLNNNTLIGSRPGTPQTPATPSSTPQTPYSLDSYDAKNNGSATAITATGTRGGTQRRTRQSRADAILNRVRRQTSTAVTVAANITTNVTAITTASLQSTEETIRIDPSQKYLIWQTDYALRFFKKVQHELKDFLGISSRDRKLQSKTYTVEPISLKGGFIKVESKKHNYRPYYQVFRRTNATEWPKIELSREEGAFRLSPKKSPLELVKVEEEPHNNKMTRKSRSRSSTQHQRPLPTAVQSLKKADTTAGKTSTGQRHSNVGAVGACCKQVKESSDKQCGVCEICKIEYDTLTIHLKTKDHEYFARNSQNFIALDTLINSSADVNKFLDDENKKNELKSELEEMEVEEDMTADVNAPDPLEDDPDPLPMAMQHEEKRRSSGAHKTPSPSLREKSKRTTKGKHSSEKFRNATATTTSANATLKQSSKSPKIPPKAASPQKKPSSSMLELQRIETAAAAKATSAIILHHCTRRKPTTAATVSPPIRAMLPPSSLYKVVETPETCSPTRKLRETGGEQALASPSLIVKFKKVRQAELFRLNGEAENFMFPKRRTSSELATDIDRQTTSDNVRASTSSTSLDTTSSELMDVIETDNTNVNVSSQKPPLRQTAIVGVVDIGKRAIATAKRRKGKQEVANRKQSFPIAPIQPEIQLKRLRKLSSTKTTNATATTTMTTTNITLPEATRKSSRTATAIVTAATTSSRLLRAAVEAAKNNNRRNAVTICNEVSSLSLMSSRRKCASPPMSKSLMETPNNLRRSRSRITVVKMEDGMGDNDDDEEELNTDESDNDEDEDNDDDEQDNDDEDDESDDEQEDDDDDDEDYIHSNRFYYKQRQLHARTSILADHHDSSTRKQRAARRELRKSEINVAEAEDSNENDSDDDEHKAYDISPKKSIIVKQFDQQQLVQRIPTPTKKSTITPRLFDYTNCDRLNKLRYAFERLPAADLWYRVFKRQDNCEERYYEYFGSTKYHKLPYELGPIPFDRTVVAGGAASCKLCNKDPEVASSVTKTNKESLHGGDIKRTKKNTIEKIIQMQETSQAEGVQQTSSSAVGASSPAHSGTGAPPSHTYTLKHKKLHLLQRYREEQQELLQKKQHEANTENDRQHVSNTLTLDATSGAIPKCDSKANTPDRERLRASSTHSNASSCASSSTTTMSKQKYRNKHLNKAAFLSLELPPRKSPREHASTLALVSCLIKQRQDSESKPNSEVDEPPTTPTSIPTIKEETKSTKIFKADTVSAPVAAAVVDVPSARSPRNTRSAAATPVEELRFTTEISENVKRMRRGQNKYDHSPPIVLNSSRVSRGHRQTTKSPIGRRIYQHKQKYVRSQTPNTTTERRRYKRKNNILPVSAHTKHNSAYGVIRAQGGGSIRKTGSKKGVLEFEMDSAALKALDASTKHTKVQQLESEIDKYLQLVGKDYDMEIDVDIATASQLNNSEGDASTNATQTEIPAFRMVVEDDDKIARLTNCTNTPPPTDYFSSDFDLYDLVTSTNLRNGDPDAVDGRRKSGFSLYNSVALHNYFRKRKNLKSNRTGWPKVQKKKSSARQQQLLQQKIRFLKEIGEKTDGNRVKQEPIDDESTKDQTREGGGVITPPDSDTDVNEDGRTVVNDAYEDDDDADETELDAAESIPEEDDVYTMADSVEDEHEATTDAIAVRNADADGDVDIDADEEYDDDDATAEFEDAVEEEEDYKPASKRTRRSTIVSPIEKVRPNSLTLGAAATMSTHSAHLLRGLRRTPQLNGSLGSCVSPSEKAGDNSDIFTVSSDGLDTDLDISNSHSQHKLTGGGGEEDASHREHHCTNPQTSKRKFDLSKYATNNTASSTCAAEAATAAVKSLAISQFLKKEVRVNCRRLRTPFRRFRYRR